MYINGYIDGVYMQGEHINTLLRKHELASLDLPVLLNISLLHFVSLWMSKARLPLLLLVYE